VIAFLKGLGLVIASIPDLIKLARQIEAWIKKNEEDRTVKDSLKQLTETFKDGDAEKLRKIFNS
jgi:hypothetical protein